MAACTVCQSVKLLVHVFCVVHTFLTQRQIGFVCGVLMPYNVKNVGMLAGAYLGGLWGPGATRGAPKKEKRKGKERKRGERREKGRKREQEEKKRKKLN